jgi:hypothetical protein
LVYLLLFSLSWSFLAQDDHKERCILQLICIKLTIISMFNIIALLCDFEINYACIIVSLLPCLCIVDTTREAANVRLVDYFLEFILFIYSFYLSFSCFTDVL